jgi:predicted porin
MNNASRFRLNVGGETDITSDLKGIAFYEAEQTVDNGSNQSGNTGNTAFKQRYMYAGLSTNGNTVSFGKQDAATVQISQMSDNVSTYSGAQKTFINAGDEQINNAINYYGYFMDALSVKASYLASNEKSKDGYALSGIYTTPFGLGVGLGYAANENDGSQDSTQFIGGLSYKWEGLYVAGTYTQGKGSKKDDSATPPDNDFKGYELVAHYKFDNGFQAVAGYQKGELDVDGDKKYNVSDYFELTGKYHFTSSLNSYISYKFNNLKKEDEAVKNSNNEYVDADNSLRLGLLYLF